jgi:hypothetical protein
MKRKKERKTCLAKELMPKIGANRNPARRLENERSGEDKRGEQRGRELPTDYRRLDRGTTARGRRTR